MHVTADDLRSFRPRPRVSSKFWTNACVCVCGKRRVPYRSFGTRGRSVLVEWDFDPHLARRLKAAFIIIGVRARLNFLHSGCPQWLPYQPLIQNSALTHQLEAWLRWMMTCGPLHGLTPQ